MELRIKFNASVVINGKNLSDIRSKWENLPLWSEEAQKCSAEFCEVELVDDEDFEDLTSKFEGYEDDDDEEDDDDDDDEYVCPECGWCGNEHEVIEDDDEEDDEEDDAWYNDDWDEDDDDNWIECCPHCSHQFTQWEHNYNNETRHLDYKCPKCGWTGNENEIAYVR
jgi:predicted RNA-binding Zn-ribbon protein involved in translation (DUF1610 family)